MRLLLLYWICLTLTHAVKLPGSVQHSRLDVKDTDAMLANTDGKGIVQTSPGNANFVLSYKNNTTTSRQKELKNTNLETKTKEPQQINKSINQLQTVVHEDKYNITNDYRGKREFLDEAQVNKIIKRDHNSYLQTYVPLLHKHRPLSPKMRSLLLPKTRKGIFPKHHSALGLLGSVRDSALSSEDSPESIVLKMLSSNQHENYEGFKNVGLTKTIAFNVTKLIDKHQESNFFLEKNENLTVEVTYLDSQERETKYSDTHNSKVHKVVGPEMFGDEWAPEENIEGNSREENLDKNGISSNRNGVNSDGNLYHGFVQNTNIPTSDYKPESPSEFVGGSFVGSGKGSIYSPNIKNKSQTFTEVEEESSDLLGQPNVVNPIHPNDVIPDLTMKDIQQLIEDSIIEKGYTESSLPPPGQVSEKTMNLPESNNNQPKIPGSTSSNLQAKGPRTNEIFTSPYPEQITKSIVETPDSEDVTASLPKDTAATYYSTLNPSNDTHVLIIKHGESIVLDPNDGVTVMSLTRNENEANSAISQYNTSNVQEVDIEESTSNATDELEIEEISTTFYPPRGIDTHHSSNQVQSTVVFDGIASSEDEKEDDGSNEDNTQTISGKDPRTEEVSVETGIAKADTESSASDDKEPKNTTNFEDTTSNIIIKEGISKPPTKTNQALGKESTALNPNEEVEPSMSQSNDNVENEESEGDDEYLQKKPKDTWLKFPYKGKPNRDDLNQPISYNSMLVSSTEPNIIDKVPTHGHPKSKLDDKHLETSENVDEVTGEFSNIDPSKIKIDDKYSIAPLSVDDMDEQVQGSTLDNEISRGDTTPLHAVELFGGQVQGKGQQVNDRGELSNSKPSSVSGIKVEPQTSNEETLTELCFPLMNEKKVSLYDLLSGKLYLEKEGKKIQLKLKDNHMNRCNSGTRNCKLPISFENTNESVKETGSLSEGADEIHSSSNQVQSAVVFDGRGSIEDEKEDDDSNEDNTQTILEKDPRTEEVSVETGVTKAETKSSASDDKKPKNTKHFEETESLPEGVDETDSNATAKVSKRSVIEDKINLENKEKEVMDNLSTALNIPAQTQQEIMSRSEETSNIKQIFLTDLLLMLLTNETSSNSNVTRCTHASKSTVEVAPSGQNTSIIIDSVKNSPPPLTLVSLIKQISEDKDTQSVNSLNLTFTDNGLGGKRSKRSLVQEKDAGQDKEGGCECGSMPRSEGEWSGKRFKRTLLPQQDGDQDKEGGCGCGSMLGRTLPPIPNHDHFLGKRLNIITSIAHAIKDWAITRPTH